jgi:ATP-dependent DNA helicase DinG
LNIKHWFSTSELESIFSEEGPLSEQIEGYRVRPDQLTLALVIQEALEQRNVLLSEAGTGTGKTFAYLVPALLNGERVIISTGTKTLQDQLYQRDIPMVRDALKVPVVIALLKGRSNYLCSTRLDRELKRDRYEYREDVGYLQKIVEWRGRTHSGDLSELTSIPEEAPIRNRVCSHPDICLGSECDYHGECYLNRARKSAQEADVVVINHHLLFADLALKEEGVGEVLPEAAAYIIDEAHQVPEIATRFFGFACSSRSISDFLDELRLACRLAQLDEEPINELSQRISDRLHALLTILGQENQRSALTLSQNEQIHESFMPIVKEMEELISLVSTHGDASKALTGLIERGEKLCKLMMRFEEEPEAGDVRWYETHRRSFMLHQTPINIAPQFSQQLEKYSAAWVFTSATLAVDHSFDHFSQQLGLNEAKTLSLGSPFNFEEQAYLYLPKGFPAPSEPLYLDRVIRLSELLIDASRGRAFILFTSHRALQRAAEVLKEKLEWPLFVQGEMPRNELLHRFRESGEGVLMGTSSFWEGVDVRGAALSLVIIDKLPFASPSDPVLEARRKWLEEEGRNPFYEMQLPEAVIMLKQGVGRLIRDEADRGVMVICDPRIVRNSYGSRFLNSLPPMKRSNRYQEIVDFLKTL